MLTSFACPVVPPAFYWIYRSGVWAYGGICEIDPSGWITPASPAVYLTIGPRISQDPKERDERAVLLRRDWRAFIMRALGAKAVQPPIPDRFAWARPFSQVRAFRSKLIEPG